jgi:hypothetical protein
VSFEPPFFGELSIKTLLRLFFYSMSTTLSPLTRRSESFPVEVQSSHTPMAHLRPVPSGGFVSETIIEPAARVPDEIPAAMRRQPTPELVFPFRWSGWNRLWQLAIGTFRIGRLALGTDRD